MKTEVKYYHLERETMALSGEVGDEAIVSLMLMTISLS
jgi:hypothetical protein